MLRQEMATTQAQTKPMPNPNLNSNPCHAVSPGPNPNNPLSPSWPLPITLTLVWGDYDWMRMTSLVLPYTPILDTELVNMPPDPDPDTGPTLLLCPCCYTESLAILVGKDCKGGDEATSG